MEYRREVSFNDVALETVRIARSAPLACLAYLATVFAAGAGPDILAPEEAGWFFAGSVVSLAAGFVVIRVLLDKAGLTQGGSNGFGSYFVLGILITLATGLGLLLLIVPGLYLMVRWLPAYGVLMAEDVGITESLGRSWDITAGRVAPLAVVTLMLVLVLGVALAMYVLPDFGASVPMVATLLAGNFLIATYTVGLTVAGLGAYGALCEHERDLDLVFA